ncbi:MAG: serine/threonine protein phosphatase [Streptococcaceae bacterium]|jgi:serine/threonine protein phosphatase 1|nr:serine/threonine protein phosphatase [Streptococcaceae bacterium]
MKYFAVSDIHGKITAFNEVLKVRPDDAQLVLLGDYVDRGEDSKAVLQTVKHLVEIQDAVALKGNHEQLFLQFLYFPNKHYMIYYANGGKETIESFLYYGVLDELAPSEVASKILAENAELIDFMLHLPLFFETKHHLFVHAGIDLTKDDWHDTAIHQFTWIREEFHNTYNQTGKTIVFGHTPTAYLHGDAKNHELWIKDNKIGIDGGIVFGGVLHGVLIDGTKIIDTKIRS